MFMVQKSITVLSDPWGICLYRQSLAFIMLHRDCLLPCTPHMGSPHLSMGCEKMLNMGQPTTWKQCQHGGNGPLRDPFWGQNFHHIF